MGGDVTANGGGLIHHVDLCTDVLNFVCGAKVCMNTRIFGRFKLLLWVVWLMLLPVKSSCFAGLFRADAHGPCRC